MTSNEPIFNHRHLSGVLPCTMCITMSMCITNPALAAICILGAGTEVTTECLAHLILLMGKHTNIKFHSLRMNTWSIRGSLLWGFCITIGHVNEYPTMHYFGLPRQTQSMIAYGILTEYFWKFQWRIAIGMLLISPINRNKQHYSLDTPKVEKVIFTWEDRIQDDLQAGNLTI